MNFYTSPTIKELAREAGVSVMTASRVFNHPDQVAKKTRLKVLSAAKRINYRPNSVAQALSYGRNNIIFVYIPSDIVGTNPFYLDVLAGISEKLGEVGYSVLLRKSWYQGENADGVILMGLNRQDTQRTLELCQQKQVVIFGHIDGADCIDVDNKLGMKMMGDYLIKCHRKRVLYLSVNSDRTFFSEREAGLISSLEGKEEYSIARLSKNDTQTAYQYMKKSFDISAGYDTICCATDELALGVSYALRERGIKIPQDISVTGFDGLGREKMCVPAITTVRQPIFEIGVALAERLVARIKGASLMAEKRFVMPELLIGESVSSK